MPKKLRYWLALPADAIRLITRSRLTRLWYYLRSNQIEIIFDRIGRLLKIGNTETLPLLLYQNADYPDPIVFAPSTTPLVSILIPVYNQWATTRACLISICENTPDIPYEIIVADDGSTDETINLMELAPGIRHIVNKENLGFLKNCNNAATKASGKYLLLLNNDTQVQPGWLTPLVALAEQDKHVGLVGPMLLYPDGHLQEAGGIIWQDGSGWNYGRLDYPERPEYNYLKQTDYISGACILLPKSLWDNIGGFDERFAPAYYEDTDLAFEIRRRGYKVMYQPLSKVVHLEGLSHGTDVGTGVKRHQQENLPKFLEKWTTALQNNHARGPEDLYRARERSLGRKTLLFIDHYVPQYDQDAGSKTTFHYLRLLVEMGYSLKFLGDNFVDYQPYTTTLQQMGVEVLYGRWFHRNWKKWFSLNGCHLDYVCVARPDIAAKYIPVVRQTSPARIMYLGHDLHFLRESRNQANLGNLDSVVAYWRKQESTVLHAADVSYYFSDYEIAEIRRLWPEVTARMVPTFLLEDSEIKTTETPFEARTGLLFVGGFMHQPNADGIKWFVREVFQTVQTRYPGVRLNVVGSNPPADVLALAGADIAVTGWVSNEELWHYYEQARIVIAPLRFGAGVKAKIVESMSFGVPVVTTNIGAEGITDAGNALMVADTSDAFANAVCLLLEQQTAWEEKRMTALNAVKKHISKQAARDIFIADMPL